MKRTFLLSAITVLGISILCSCQNASNSLSKATMEQITEIENTHNISILYDGKEVKDELIQDYTLAKDIDEIAEAVEAADVILGRLPKDWAMTIANPDMKLEGIRMIENVSVVFCEELKNEKDALGNEFELKGLYEFSEDTMYLLVDIHNFDPEIAIAEGIMNRIIRKQVKDDELLAYIMADEIEKGTYRIKYLYDYYTSLNPESFRYYNYIAEIKDEDKKYLYENSESVDEVYFVNEAAMYNEFLDCLYTMTPLLYTDKEESLPEVYNSEKIQDKILYTRIKINYMFDDVDMYWDSWFE